MQLTFIIDIDTLGFVLISVAIGYSLPSKPSMQSLPGIPETFSEFKEVEMITSITIYIPMWYHVPVLLGTGKLKQLDHFYSNSKAAYTI